MRITLLTLIAGTFIFIFGCSVKPPKPPPVPPPAKIEVMIHPVILDELERTRPQVVVVYETLPGDAKKWVERFKEVSKLDGQVEETQDLIRVQDQSRYLEIRKASHTAFYGDMDQLWKEEPNLQKKQYKIPSSEEAKEIAWKMLQQYGFSAEALLQLELSVSDNMFEIIRPDNTNTPIRVIVGKDVEIRRRVDDLLVYGPGSKIKVYIGEKGINGYMATWRQIDPASRLFGHITRQGQRAGKHVPLITAQEAFERLRENPLDHLPLALVKRIDITRVKLGYYARSAVEQQKYFQPVYVFYGTALARSPEGKELAVPYEQFVVAVDESFESIWPETREFAGEPQQKRELRKPVIDEDERVR